MSITPRNGNAKTAWTRRCLALDPGTLGLLAGYRDHCHTAAAGAEDGYVFPRPVRPGADGRGHGEPPVPPRRCQNGR